MSLARVKTWIPGDILTASDLNAEFNNVINNPVSLISNATSLVAGDVLIASTDATPVLSRLAVGKPTQYVGVTSSASQPTWVGVGMGTRVSGLIATISSQTSTCAARQYVLQTTDGRQSFLMNSTDSFTINVGTAGPAAGGRDTAGVFSSTFVHLYAISTGANSTGIAGTASTAVPPTGPVMPTSYSAWCYLGGVVYTSASTAMADGYLTGAQTRFKDLGDFPALAAGTATVATQISVSSGVPANALRFSISTKLLQSTAAAGTSLQADFGVHSTVTASDSLQLTEIVAQVVGVTAQTRLPMEFPNIAQGLYYLNTSTAVATSVNIFGFTNPNGDV